MSLNGKPNDQKWSRSQIRALSCLLAVGGLVGLINPITLGESSSPIRIWISLSTGTCLLVLLAVLQRTRALIPVVLMATPVVFACFISGFVLTGDLYYVALGMTLPIGVALFDGTRRATVVLLAYVGTFLSVAFVYGFGFAAPPIAREAYMASLFSESIVMALITIAITGSTIWKEKMVRQVRRAEANAKTESAAQQRRFETICQNAYDAIFETQTNGVVTWAHGRLISEWGYQAGDLQDTNLLHRLPKSAQRKILRQLKSNGGTEANFCIECAVDDRDGAEKWLRISGGNYKQPENQERWVIAVQDINDEIANLGRVLEHSRLESLGTVCGGLAHDFNNLLTVIGIYGEMVENPEVRNGILQSQRQAADLTASLLTFARKQDFRQQTLELCDFLESSRVMIERLVPANVQCKWSFSTSDAWVCIDPGQLHQVVINLVNNAIHAMPSGGTLTIQVDTIDVKREAASIHELHPGEFARMSVQDTGTGMTPNTLQHSMEPFFTTKPRGEGTGLGLATAHGTARRAGGWIDLVSEINIGTTVEVILPLQRKPTQIVSNESGNTSHDDLPHEEKGRVLVIEDRESLREVISKTLTSAGHHVTQCENGEDGWQAISEGEEFDFYIADIVLPGMTGLQWIRKVRNLIPDAKVVLISGHQQDDISIVNERPDITWFLPKPFSTSDLLTAVHQIQASSTRQASTFDRTLR